MLGMVNDLIDYANGRDADALSPQPVYTYALLDTVAQHGAALAARGGNAFSVEIAGNLPPVIELDDRRMQQVLGNLLDNAAKFTEHGTIRLTVTGRADAAAPRRWNLRFAIADSGCGIAAADRARVFEPFVRALEDDHRPGIGLGLHRQALDHAHGRHAAPRRAGHGNHRRHGTARQRDGRSGDQQPAHA